MKKIDGWKIFTGRPKDFSEKELVTRRCLEIAERAKFPTDYEDMYEHLFENENAELFMVIDDSNEIFGFATFDNDKETSTAYLHGIIVHPDIQGIGFSVKLIQEAINKFKNNFLMARTHNPRVYEMMSRVSYDGIIFPNTNAKEVPLEIWNVVLSHEATKHADENLIVRDAYPDEKVIQDVRNEEIQNVFSKLNPRDAQVIVVCTQKPNFDY